MARRGPSFYSIAMAAARAADRAHRASVREAARRERARLRDEVRNQREMAIAAKNAYLQDRVDEVEDLNTDIHDKLEELNDLLANAWVNTPLINWEGMKEKPDFRELSTPQYKIPEVPSLEEYLPVKPNALACLVFPSLKDKHAARCEQAKKEHSALRARQEEVKALRQGRREELKAEAETQHKEIDELKQAFEKGEPEILSQIMQMALEDNPYPDGFPSHVKVAYVPDNRQLVIELELPTVEVIPAVERHKYVKAADTIQSSPRRQKDIQSLYALVVAQVVLCALHEAFKVDEHNNVESVALNAYVKTIDPATGKEVQPYLLSVRTTREAFTDINLGQVDPLQCLKRLSAEVSRNPAELQPVKPIVDFNMVDKRFVAEIDVLSGLADRPNLMELSPGEFENLITNLFAKMGLETKLTQASRDGGVDCVAFDPRPILGGKVIIQAKRYKNTVGVGAVRDLFGTMHNEGASKGILVTTSGYGSAAFDFAKSKPLELISGGELLYLLKEHGQMDATIIMPAEV